MGAASCPTSRCTARGGGESRRHRYDCARVPRAETLSKLWGDGTQNPHWTYIEDIVEGTIWPRKINDGNGD